MRPAFLLACGLALVGCAAPTSIVIHVESDFAAPTEVDHLQILVTARESLTMIDQNIELTDDFPHEYRVFPHPGFEDEPVTITVVARLGDTFVVQQGQETEFAQGAHRRVELHLYRACMGRPCAVGVPCTEDGNCPLAECMVASDCNDNIECTDDRCESSFCVNRFDDTRCPEGTVCHPTRGCGEPCTDAAECVDGMFCNGEETCVAEHCLFGELACNDNDVCTEDVCDEASDSCSHPPPVEMCNGIDDDCDTVCDNGFECCANAIEPCTTGCGMGTRRCNADVCTWQTCVPPAETCNGMDDDCDTRCDNTFGCCQNVASDCVTECGSTGSALCDSTCTLGTCQPPGETCNGMDDDCDDLCDEDFLCCAGVTPCRTSCDPVGATTGTQVCSATCQPQGGCIPPAEDCTNGRDDNCVGGIDCADPTCSTTAECMGGCSGCPGEVEIQPPGGRFSVTLGADEERGNCGGFGGSEGYLTFTITSPSDIFATTHGAGVDTVLYLRTGTTCCGAEVACNDDADGLATSLLRENIPAGTYHLIVDTKAAMSRTISVDVYIEAPGPGGFGDRCANPSAIPPGTPHLIDSASGNANDYQPVIDAASECPNAGPSACDRVYYFVLDAPTTVTFNGCNASSANSYDQIAYIRSVCTQQPTQQACDDDCAPPNMICNNGRRNASVTATIGPGLFYFVADGWCGATCDLTNPCVCGNFDYTLTGI